MFRVAVTGLSGVLGQNLRSQIPVDWQILDLYHQHPIQPVGSEPAHFEHVHFDLLQAEELSQRLRALNPDAIIHLAAITHIDRCEADRTTGRRGVVWRVNVGATAAIARYCREHRKHLVFMSTECVFDGRDEAYQETDATSPRNWYGSTKAAAEAAIQQLDFTATIIRAVVAYSTDVSTKTLLSFFYHQLTTGQPTWAATDQVFSPTFIPDITQTLISVVRRRLTGIFHVTPQQTLSPYDFARLVAIRYQLDPSLVTATTLRELFGVPRAKLRLRHAVLASQVSARVLATTFTSPAQALQP